MGQSKILIELPDENILVSNLLRLSNECKDVIDKLADFGKKSHNESHYIEPKVEKFDLSSSVLFFQRDLKLRRLRAEFFGSYRSLNEYTWNILTDIYLCDLSGISVSIKRACLVTGLPPTTALRWIGALEEESLVFREQDGSDRRRQFLHISESCRTKLFEFSERWFRQADE